jgi:two-component system sensor histidine kinase/response regulator
VETSDEAMREMGWLSGPISLNEGAEQAPPTSPAADQLEHAAQRKGRDPLNEEAGRQEPRRRTNALARLLRHSPLRNKLTSIMMLASGGALLLAAGAFMAYDLLVFRDGQIRRFLIQADIVGLNCAPTLLRRDPGAARNCLAAFSADSEIVSAAISTNDGTVVARYRSDLDEGDNLPAVRSGARHWIAEGDLHVVRTIAVDGQDIGSIYVRAEAPELFKHLGDFAWIVTEVLVFSSLGALILSARLQRLISEPISRLANTMRLVSERRNYSIRAGGASEDELGALIAGFNDMLEQIELRDQILREHREELEDEVEIRTAELSESNRYLQETIAQLERTQQEAQKANRDLEQANQDLRLAIDRTKQMALEAEIANQAKSEFVANMSHEIRTPIHGVLGMLQLIRETSLTREQREYAEVALSSTDSLLHLINGILDFSKIEADRLALESTPVNLREIVENVTTLLAKIAHGKGLELSCFVPPDTPSEFCGDPTRIGQIFTNLIGNAIKFTAQGEVSVRVQVVEETDAHARFLCSVTDTGIGLSTHARERVFDAFTQADGSTTRKFGGTGLGLAVTRKLVELMGGQIGVESEPGRGSTFWVMLSLGKTTGDLPELPTPTRLPQGRALLVAKQSTSRRVVEDYLRHYSISCVVIDPLSDPLESLREASERAPSYALVLLDVSPAESKELKLAELLEPASPWAGTPIILLAPIGQPYGAVLGVQPAAYLSKPVRLAALLDTLASVAAEQPGELDAPPGEHVTKRLDLETVAEVRKTVGAGFEKLVGIFLSDNERLIRRAGSAAEQCDAQGLLSMAQSIRSSAARLGATHLSSLATQLELLSRKDPMGGADRVLAEMAEELERVKEAFGALVQTKSPQP